MDDQTTRHDVPLDAHICFSLYAASHAMNRVYQPLLREHGLTYPQYITLVALWDKGEMSVGELGQILALETNTLTPLLKRLETAGYVLRTRSKEDERRVVVSLTEKGKEFRATSGNIPACILSACDMPDAELARLQEGIDALRKTLRNA